MRRNLLTLAVIVFVLTPVIILGQAVIQKAAGVNQIAAALAAAQPGDVIELTTSGGIYQETATTVVNKNITIRGAAGLAEQPVWTCDNNSKQIILAANLTLQNIRLDGSQGAASTKDCIYLDTVVKGTTLKIFGCIIEKFDNGTGTEGHAIKGTTGTQMDTLIVKDTFFRHIAHEHISFKDESADLQPGTCKYLWVENCTFWDGMNEAIYFQASDNVPAGTPDPKCYFINLTVVSLGSKVLYPNEIDGALIRNCIVINNSTQEYGCRLYGTNSKVEGFLYWNCPNGIELMEGALESQLSLVQKEVDPLMVDVANGDFTLKPGSPALAAGVSGANLGDRRWWGSTAVEDRDRPEIVESCQLNQNYPNPFNPSTKIGFNLPQTSHVRLQVFNSVGREIVTLVDGPMTAGFHSISWNAASDVSAGIYFYKLTTNEISQVRKMILIK